MSPAAIKAQVARALSLLRAPFRAVIGKLAMAKPVQLANVDGLAGEPVPGLELMQHFGFTSTPPDGTTAIVVPLGGRTSASVIVATEHSAHRLVLNERGEAALYTQDGSWVHLKREGQVHIKAGVRVLIESPLTETTGSLLVGGNVAAVGSITDQVDGDGTSMQAMRDVFNDHVHEENNNSGPTDQPTQQM
ncbi:MAG: phage baseplate assembly protein [Gammaproteobacteria bacterium]|nr:phage baseplate assembly protein [Gammaproteobacteria bacterium]